MRLIRTLERRPREFASSGHSLDVRLLALEFSRVAGDPSRVTAISRRMVALAGMFALLLIVVVGPDAVRAETVGYTGTIAFLRWPAGSTDYSSGPSLYVIRADGSGLRRLTPAGTSVLSYAWSPDGETIAYTDTRLSLWLVQVDGIGRRLLLPTSRLSTVALSWSPNGTTVAIVSPGPKANFRHAWCTKLTLYVVPIDRSPVTPLRAGVGCDVAWSPRGDEIAYTASGPNRSGTWAIHPDGSGDRRIASVGGGKWSADGARLSFGIAIHPRPDTVDRYRAFAVVNADGTNYHVVTTHAYNEYGEAWSPHGHQILYGRADHKGVYLIGSDGRNNHRVTRDSPPQAGWGALAWSPTGGSIAYTTGNFSNTDLYLIGIDGRGKTHLTNTPDIDIAPSWVAR